jgi:ketosteroid isomerase-like protein
MAPRDVSELARALYAAFTEADRPAMEALLGDDFRFSSPQDDRIDRAAYFERCWPGAGKVRIRSIERLLAQGDEAFVRYVAEGGDGVRFQNVELVTARDGQVVNVEVYFGWNIPRKPSGG